MALREIAMPQTEGSAHGMPSKAPGTEAMPEHTPKLYPAGIRRFGAFEVDFQAGELRGAGMRISIQGQPLQVLSILLDRPGEVITRGEFRDLLWPEHTFVDFDHSLNSAIRKLRHALSDHPEMPRLIETLPRHGYRFIGPVEAGAARPAYSAPGDMVRDFAAGEALRSGEEEAARIPSREHGRQRRGRRRARSVAVATGLALVVAGLCAGLYRSQRRTARPPVHPTVMLAVIPLDTLGRDPSEAFMAQGMTEELITQLGRAAPDRVGVVARSAVERYKHTTKPVSVIGKELGVDYVLVGSAQVEENRVRIAAQLIKVSDQTHIWANQYDSTLDDMQAVPAAVAASVVQAIRGKLNPPPQPAGMGPAGDGTTRR